MAYIRGFHCKRLCLLTQAPTRMKVDRSVLRSTLRSGRCQTSATGTRQLSRSPPVFAHRPAHYVRMAFMLIQSSPSDAQTHWHASMPLSLCAVRDFHSKRTCLLTQAPPAMKVDRFVLRSTLRSGRCQTSATGTRQLTRSPPVFAIRAIALLAHTGQPVRCAVASPCEHASASARRPGLS